MGPPASFESAYNLNVFDYFNLCDSFDSDLKKNVFKQTSNYKILADSLKSIRAWYLNSAFYDFGFDAVSGQNFTEEANDGYSQKAYAVNYNIQRKGFFIGIGDVLPYHCSNFFLPKVVKEVEFSQLSITKVYNLFQSKRSYTQYIFIPMEQDAALEIENNREDIEILRVFNLKSINTATYADPDFIAENGKPCIVKIVKGGSLRLLIYNKKTERIYFDKLYIQLKTK